MWPIKERENKQLLILWPNLIPLYQAVGMRHYGSLININPSVWKEKWKMWSLRLLLLLVWSDWDLGFLFLPLFFASSTTGWIKTFAKFKIVTSRANLKWLTRPGGIVGDYFVLCAPDVRKYVRTYVDTDTIIKNNEPLMTVGPGGSITQVLNH